MSQVNEPNKSKVVAPRSRPFRKALLNGLTVLAPPLVTIVLFVWLFHMIEAYVLGPVEAISRNVVFLAIDETQSKPKDDWKWFAGAETQRTYIDPDGRKWVPVRNAYIPADVYQKVEDNPGERAPATATAYYYRFIELQYLRREFVIPIFLLIFLLVLYFLGKFMAAGIGRLLWMSGEKIIQKLPIINNVYSSVKQVTDFAFSQNELTSTRIVAIQYPRKGLWQMAFLTGEGMADICNAANEPCVNVLVPTSPMPATGFTVIVPKSEVLDLNLSMDQAIQFCVSCGVVIPTHQQQVKGQGKPPMNLPPAVMEKLIQANLDSKGLEGN